MSALVTAIAPSSEIQFFELSTESQDFYSFTKAVENYCGDLVGKGYLIQKVTYNIPC